MLTYTSINAVSIHLFVPDSPMGEQNGFFYITHTKDTTRVSVTI